ncbi:neutral/alkaline non-lysosomal ceramidase N-terminal domain-containing protein, partial [Tautonia marina]|uniref:neutral/alkaline non-lysosomal ceramidase N-terminal domain-containing protein n=1 Tax=Tautonia marina TaxID=2653855 RepID=UPI0012606AC7
RVRSDLRTLLLLAVLWCFAGPASATDIRAGVARVDITPPIGGPTAGYSSAEPTDGIHDRIDARVLVLESSSTTIALVACDLCVFNSPWLHEQMPELGIDRLLLINTHTHAGPDLRDEVFPSPEEPWRVTVERRVLEAIREAQKGLFSAQFLADEGSITLGYNRLVRHGNTAVTHFENPDHIPYGPVDPTVGVIRITDEEEDVRAVLVTYACHPVILGPRNRKISADYPGVMRDLVEEELGGDVTCMFLQGGGGDINPLLMARGDDRDGDFAVVERVGRRLAEEVLDVLERLEDEPGSSKSLSSASAELTVENRWEPDEELTLGVTSVLINDEIGLITMPGEPFHAFQVAIRQMAGLPHAYLLGYCCDGPYAWPSYLPDLQSAARGGYGASDTTRAEVGAGERLVNKGLAQLFTLAGRLKGEPRRHPFEDD